MNTIIANIVPHSKRDLADARNAGAFAIPSSPRRRGSLLTLPLLLFVVDVEATSNIKHKSDSRLRGNDGS